MAKKEDKDKEQKKEKKGRQKGKLSNSREAKMKLIPPFVMLTAGAVTSILMVVKGCELHEFLARLLLILVIFYMLGCLLKGILDMIEKQNRPPEPEEGEDGAGSEDGEGVIEKGPDEESTGEDEESMEEETPEE